MIEINIVKDFTDIPGFRTYSDGPKSGLEFFEKVLLPKFDEAIANSDILKVVLDGSEGYTSSFLNESFRLLSSKYGPQKVWDNVLIVSNEVPKYILRIKEAIFEDGKK